MLEIKENIHCFQYMFFYIFIIGSLIYLRLVLKYLQVEGEDELFIRAMDYWKKKPIWKITPINDGSEEPTNMEKYSVGVWPGIVKGCNCSNIYYNYYLKGSCSNENIRNGCTNVEEQGPKNIYKYYFRYYVTYYDSDYLNLLSRVEKNKNISTCKKGYKKCGKLDSLWHPFCVKEKEDCVINHFYFRNKDNMLYLYYGFNESLIDRNIAVNNLFIADSSGCILNEDYLTDEFLLFKNKTNKLQKCNIKSVIGSIEESEINKYELYRTNNIYNGDGLIPGEESFYIGVSMYAMIYYGLSDSITEYYYSDAFIFKHLTLFNILIFIILKVGIQLGYYIFIQKSILSKKREIIYNIIWAFAFASYLILIWLFNNSLYRSAQFISVSSNADLNKKMEILRIIDILLAFIILSVHLFKLIFIIVNKNKKKYSEFINLDK